MDAMMIPPDSFARGGGKNDYFSFGSLIIVYGIDGKTAIGKWNPWTDLHRKTRNRVWTTGKKSV